MKTLGLIGGLSWFSTAEYYRIINQLTNDRLGDSNSAKLFLYSINFNEFKTLQEDGDWQQIEIMLTEIALQLENAGADCIVMCSNTPHCVADGVQHKINIPLIHIAEETAKEIAKQKIRKVGLLGTKFTMEHSFFRKRLSRYNIQANIPDAEDRDFIHLSIFNQLTKGIFTTETKNRYLDIIEKLREDGAEGIILGCTEISLMIKQEDCILPLFDTTAIHTKSAVDFMLQ